ncbi:MarR family winged helix-turn-helix transcriptional regulator [Nocardiopsis algeriensis]|uniref:MarR family winged helix-turn-helix transcriptional regulator n=1 Tax=Nocardiopsis algeriensis TaxID=1478215 RepID=UPI003B435539
MTTLPPDGPRRSDDTSNLGWALAVVLRRWQELAEAELSDVPHGSRGFHVLGACADEEAPTQAALAARLLIDRSVMTYLLDDLEKAGLVRRRVDPGDRRVRRVCATERGREFLADLRGRVARVEERVLSGLDAQARELFRAAAGRAAAAVQRAEPELDPCAAVRDVAGDAPGARREQATGP